MKSRFVQIFAGVSAATILGAAGIASAATGGPSVTLTSDVTDATTSNAIPITVTFSEPVNNFSSGAIHTTNAGYNTFSGSGAHYSFILNPSAQGTTTVMIAADSAQSASSSLGNLASNVLSFYYGTPSQDNSGSNSTTTSTSTQSAAPRVSNITVADTDQTDAMVSWMTDIPATSQVFYGTNTFYGASTNLDSTATTSHSQMIYGLTAGTPYHFYVQSTTNGGTATSSDMMFTPGSGTGAMDGSSSTSTSSTSTSSTSSSTPLAITGIDSVKSTAVADGQFADGWQWILHFSVPSTENFLSLKFGDFTNGNGGTIPAASNIQFYSPQSSNAATSTSALTESNNDYTGWLNLASSTSANRNVDVYVNVAVPNGTPTGSYSTSFGAFSNTSASTSTTQ